MHMKHQKLYDKYYYGNNRFILLSDAYQTKKPRKIEDHEKKNTLENLITFSVVKGKESLFITKREPVPYTFSLDNTLQTPPFYRTAGWCSICKCYSHTHIMCPLRKCTQCNTFGHANVICCK